MRRSPLEHLENEVVETFGRGAAVSLDHDQNVWRARAWSTKGYEVACSKPSRLQADAIRDLRKKVAAKASEAPTPNSSSSAYSFLDGFEDTAVTS